MPEILLMLLIAAVIPIACVAASAFVEKGLRESATRQRRLPRRTALSVAAMLALVSTLVVAENPVTAAEGDMHVFSGTITDLEEAAQAGINVSVFCENCENGSTSDPSQNPARPWPAARWGSGARVLGEVTTDASGTWSVTVAEPSSGWPLIVAWDPSGDYAFSTISSQGWTSASGIDASLADGGRLSGRILGDGAPPPSTTFTVGGHGNNLLWQGISLVVASNGEYSTPGLPDGEYHLTYPADLAKPYVADASVRLGTISGGMDSTVNHNLLKYTSLSGRVTNSAGQALSGIRVVASPVGTTGAGLLVNSPIGGGAVFTAADGTYSFDTIVPGTEVLVEFHSPDGEYASEYYDDKIAFWRGDRVSIAEASVSGIDAQLATASRISGFVRDAAGQPLSHLGMNVCSNSPPGDCTYASTDASGFFEFRGLTAGSYRLTASLPWPQSSIKRPVVVSEGEHVQVNLGGPPGEFDDVPDNAFYTVPVRTLGSQGVFEGTECQSGFCPDTSIDRKTMAVWIVRVLDGEDPPSVYRSRFNDVNRSGFHAPFIERMAELGVTGGCGDGSGFCPDRTVSRWQMAVFLSRAYGLPDGPDPGFSDVDSNAFYATAVAELAASGITGGCGDGTGFCPRKDTTRGQMATFLYRAENRAN